MDLLESSTDPDWSLLCSTYEVLRHCVTCMEAERHASTQRAVRINPLLPRQVSLLCQLSRRLESDP